MSESNLLAVAIFVFIMMLIGLGLTMWEFRYGQPRREDEQASARQTVKTQDSLDVTARS